MDDLQFLQAIGPVHHWYQGDEQQARDHSEILSDIVADLHMDRHALLEVQKVAQYAIRQCDEGCPVSARNVATEVLRIIKGERS